MESNKPQEKPMQGNPFGEGGIPLSPPEPTQGFARSSPTPDAGIATSERVFPEIKLPREITTGVIVDLMKELIKEEAYTKGGGSRPLKKHSIEQFTTAIDEAAKKLGLTTEQRQALRSKADQEIRDEEERSRLLAEERSKTGLLGTAPPLGSRSLH